MSRYYFGLNSTITIEEMDAFNRATAIYIVRNVKKQKVVAVAVTVRFFRKASGYTVKLLHFISFDEKKKFWLAEFVKFLTETYGDNTYGLELPPELYEGNKHLRDMGFFLPDGREDVYCRVIDREYQNKRKRAEMDLRERREVEMTPLEILRRPFKDADGKKIKWIMLKQKTDEILLRAETFLRAETGVMYVSISVPELYYCKGFLYKLITEIMKTYKDVADKIEVPIEVYGELDGFVYYKHFHQSHSDDTKYEMNIPDNL